MKPLATVNQEHANHAFGINNGKSVFSLLNATRKMFQHLLGSALFEETAAKRSPPSQFPPKVNAALGKRRADVSTVSLICMWDHLVKHHTTHIIFYVRIHALLLCFSQGLSASPVRTHVPPANILARQVFLAALIIIGAGINLGGQEGAREGVTQLLTAVRASFLCILVSPAEWDRHHRR